MDEYPPKTDTLRQNGGPAEQEGPRDGNSDQYPPLPSVKGTDFRRGDLFYSCPACGSTNRCPLDAVHPVLGKRCFCFSCGVPIHISGYNSFSLDSSDIVTTSGVPVRLEDLVDWYQDHPVTRSLREKQKQESHGDFGLWIYCARCGHKFPAAALITLLQVRNIQQMLRLGIDRDRIREMLAILSGHCPDCDHALVIVIIIDIPDKIIRVIDDEEYSWGHND